MLEFGSLSFSRDLGETYVKHQLFGLPVIAALVACAEPVDTTATVAANTSHPPSAESVAFANDVADAMIDRIVALLFREFAVTTPANAAVGSEAISNVFFDANYTMRLVGDVEPLQDTNLPQDDFERVALAAAKQGLNFQRTERVNGDWWVRKSIAVSTGFSPSCVHCHANFEGLENPWVGALMVRAQVH